MSITTLSEKPAARPTGRILAWAPIVLGLCVLYVPTLYELFTGIWAQDDQFHGPIVLAISIWLLQRKWAAMEQASEGAQPSAWGWVLVVVAMLLYAVGRSQAIGVFENGCSSCCS